MSATGTGDLPDVAVMTMARDEGPMLRRWVDHYSREVGAANLVVIDDRTSDGSTDDLPCPVLRIPGLRQPGFEPGRMALLGHLSAALLEAYEAVVFCDVDEFIVADPRQFETLRHYAAAQRGRGRQAVGVVGLNVVHDIDREPPLRDHVPILDQRRHAKLIPLMCKPSMKWVAADWALGSHAIQCPFEVDPDLWMFHMKFADRDHLLRVADARHAANQQEGRAKGTSWDRPGSEVVTALEEMWRGIDPDELKPVRPQPDNLATMVEEKQPGLWKAVGDGQVRATINRPMRRIPKRFWGRV